jgi:hypothetical protein
MLSVVSSMRHGATDEAGHPASWAVGEYAAICYVVVMIEATKEILRRVENWPQEDQEELAELACEIEARRTGVYILTNDERVALDEALRSAVASDEEVAAFWKRHGVT